MHSSLSIPDVIWVLALNFFFLHFEEKMYAFLKKKIMESRIGRLRLLLEKGNLPHELLTKFHTLVSIN